MKPHAPVIPLTPSSWSARAASTKGFRSVLSLFVSSRSMDASLTTLYLTGKGNEDAFPTFPGTQGDLAFRIRMPIYSPYQHCFLFLTRYKLISKSSDQVGNERVQVGGKMLFDASFHSGCISRHKSVIYLCDVANGGNDEALDQFLILDRVPEAHTLVVKRVQVLLENLIPLSIMNNGVELGIQFQVGKNLFFLREGSDLVSNLLESIQLMGLDPFEGHSGSNGFKDRPHFEDVLEGIEVNGRHHHSGLGLDHHQALRFKPHESLPIRRSADAELLTDPLFVQCRARLVAAENDPLFQFFVNPGPAIFRLFFHI